MKGIIKSLTPLSFDYSRVLDVHSIVADGVSSCMFDLCDSGIDFLPTEVMKGDKPTGWLGADYNKVNKVWPYVWRNFHSLVKKLMILRQTE